MRFLLLVLIATVASMLNAATGSYGNRLNLVDENGKTHVIHVSQRIFDNTCVGDRWVRDENGWRPE